MLGQPMKTIKKVLNILHGRTIGHLNFKDSFLPALAHWVGSCIDL
jgi:hypothetical protein